MKRLLVASALALAAAIAVYAALSWRAERIVERPHVEIAENRPEDMPPDHMARRAEAEQAGEIAMASGETLQVDVRTLTPGHPLVLRLLLAEPSRTGDPLAGHVYAPDGRALDLQATLGEDRSDARVEIDPNFLARGRYVVEIKTTEQSHFPIRRYAIEVN